jgi:hypothetical protein
MVHTASAVQHLQRCKEYLAAHSKTEKLMAPQPMPASIETITAAIPGKKPTDPNLKLITILKESTRMLTQTSSKVSSVSKGSTTIDDRVLGETALTLFAMAGALSEAGGEILGTINTLRSMAVIYHKGLGMTYSAAACLFRSAEIVFSTIGGQDQDKIVEEGTWDLFQALLLAMETGDFVRMQKATDMLQSHGITSFQDVQVKKHASVLVV